MIRHLKLPFVGRLGRRFPLWQTKKSRYRLVSEAAGLMGWVMGRTLEGAAHKEAPVTATSVP